MKAGAALVLMLALAACGGGREAPGGVAGLIAEKRGNVDGPGACGVRDAYFVSAAAGVRLSQPAMLTRETAQALERWVREHARPAIGRQGGGLVELQVAAHYACRSRNNRPGAKLSEHGKGRAIDIAAFVLADGSRISVLDGWRGSDSAVLRRLWRSACGPFGTVLGPEADRHHQDHLHFDIARYRGGAYCR